MKSRYTFDYNPNWNAENKKIAVEKPRLDALNIAKNIGFKDILSKYKADNKLNIIISHLTLVLNILKLKNGSNLFIQYPSNLKFFKEIFVPLIKFKKFNTYLLVHDLISLRNSKYKSVIDESNLINNFNNVIFHNQKMVDAFAKYLNTDIKFFTLDIFDYLVENPLKSNHLIDKNVFSNICFTGNLGRTHFIHDLYKIKNFNFFLYGPFYKKLDEVNHSNLEYCGSLTPEELNKTISKYDFGLIWDGLSLDELVGNDGEYIKYNNPFKFSAYISAGLPVITSVDAGIAKFIQDNGIGILVNSLTDLDNISVSVSQYYSMKQNVLKIKEKVNDGTYLKKVLNSKGN